MTRRFKVAAAITAIALAASLAVAWIVLSGAPGQRWARERLLQRLQQMTGGRVELGSFQWRLTRMEVEVGGLTIHGRPRQGARDAQIAESEPPWLHAERLQARLDVMSLLRSRIGLQSLVIERPVFHLVIYPDGSSNQPKPVGAASVGELFRMSIGHMEVRDGTFVVNERSLPLDLRAEAVKAGLASAGEGQYRGSVETEELTAEYHNLVQRGRGALQFSLRPEEAVIESMTWSAGDSSLEASGRVTSYSDPELQLEYKAQVKVEQLAQLSDMKHVRGGSVQVNGTAHYRKRRLDTTGKLALRDAEWVSGGVRVRNVNAGAEYVIGPEDASFPHIFVTALGGTVTGALEVKNWRSYDGSTPRQQGLAKLRIEGISLQNAASAASTRQLPLSKLNLRGRTSGSVDIRWTGSPASAVARFDVGITPPAGTTESTQAAPRQELPVSGSAAGSYLFGPARLEFEKLELAGPILHLTVSGELGASTANARVALSSSNLSNLTPLIGVVLPRFPQFDGIRGQGTFTGILAGTLQAPRLEGRLTLSNLEAPLHASPDGGAETATPTRVRFDTVSADVRFTPEELLLTGMNLEAGGSGISGNLRAALLQGELTDPSDIFGRLTLRDTEIAQLQSIARVEYPVSGMASGVLQIAGTWGEPRAAGQMRIRDAVVYGEPVESMDAVVLLAGSQLALDRMSASFAGAHASGRAVYNWRTQAFQVNLQGSGLQLARLRRMQSGRFLISGLAEFDISGVGTLSDPSLGGRIDVQSIALNGERLGGLRVSGTTANRTLSVEAVSQFSTGELSLQGTLGLHDDLPFKADLHIARLDVDALLAQVLKENLTGHSSAAGVVKVAGNLRTPSLLSAQGHLDQLSAGVQGIQLSNRGPIEFAVERKVLTIRQFQLRGNGTELTATGSAELSGSRNLRLQAHGNADLSLLKAFSSHLQSSGTATFEVDIGGNAANPDMRGTARVQNGSVAHQDLPNGLSGLNGTLVFNQDRLEVQSLTGRSGGGEVALGGFLNIGPRLGINLTMKGQGVRLREPPGVSSLLNLDLQLTGSGDRYTLSGNVLVTRFGITPQFDLGYYIAGLKRTSQPNPLSPLTRLHLSLNVESGAELQVETAAARLTGDVDLNVRGTAANPVLMGSVNGTEGEVVFEGARYQVNHAEITFNNPVRVEPVFDAELVTRIREYEVTLNFYGPLDRLNTTYRSEPPLPTADIVGLLAFGHTRPETVQVTRPSVSLTQSESQAILEQAMNSALNDRVQKLFGVSRLRISPPETVGTQINPSARLTLERQVSRNMTVIYVTNVSQSGQQVIQMEYNVSPSVALIATRDQNGIVSFDVRIRQRKR